MDQQKLLGGSRDGSDPLLSLPTSSSEPLLEAVSGSAKSLSNDSRGRRHKVPVFESEEDRLVFDRCLEVDITPLVSGMYTSQAVEQNVTGSTTRTTVNLFTCTTCIKVFTSLSHCQLHCLTHTDAQPYRCPWCIYATNVRG